MEVLSCKTEKIQKHMVMVTTTTCYCAFITGSSNSTHPVLPSVPQGLVSTAICQSARTLRADEYSQRHGRSQETQTDILTTD